MCKQWLIAALGAALFGCAVTLESVDSASSVASDSTEREDTAVVPLKTVELGGRADDNRSCENLTRPGSRIVVAQRCRPIDEDALTDQLGQVRREQDELDRLAREREAQRRGF
jgi:hypothetical protein